MGNRYTCVKTFEEWCIENNKQEYLDLWDYELNDKKPSEITYGTKQRYYFKCPEGIHESETRRISNITGDLNSKYTCKKCGGWGYFQDLTGRTFGELTVIKKDVDRIASDLHWICQCSCEEIVSVGGIKLRGGIKKICGKNGKHIHEFLTKEEQGRHSVEYTRFRNSVIENNENRCIICGEQLSDNEVHHIFPYATFPELRYVTTNGVCIAKKYHSMQFEGSFHRIYGTGEDNTPQNFQDYVNEKRRELGILDYFDVMGYVYPYLQDNLDIDDSMLFDLTG